MIVLVFGICRMGYHQSTISARVRVWTGQSQHRWRDECLIRLWWMSGCVRRSPVPTTLMSCLIDQTGCCIWDSREMERVAQVKWIWWAGTCWLAWKREIAPCRVRCSRQLAFLLGRYPTLACFQFNSIQSVHYSDITPFDDRPMPPYYHLINKRPTNMVIQETTIRKHTHRAHTDTPGRARAAAGWSKSFLIACNLDRNCAIIQGGWVLDFTCLAVLTDSFLYTYSFTSIASVGQLVLEFNPNNQTNNHPVRESAPIAQPPTCSRKNWLLWRSLG